MVKGNRSMHNKRVDDLLLHPEILGLEDIVISAKEVGLFTRTRQIGQPDLMYITRNGDIYIAEYKCTNSRPDKARLQLHRTEKFIYDNFGIPIKKIYVHSKYNIRTVEPKHL